MEKTIELLKLVKKELKDKNIKKCVIASTSGNTAQKAYEILGDEVEMVVVRKQYGANNINAQEMTPEMETILRNNNMKIITATHIFSGIGKAIRKTYSTWQIDEIISGVLRIFGVGVKVAIEISMMSVDAGYVNSGETIVSIGGEKKGASSAVILKAVNTSDFFNMKVEKII